MVGSRKIFERKLRQVNKNNNKNTLFETIGNTYSHSDIGIRCIFLSRELYVPMTKKQNVWFCINKHGTYKEIKTCKKKIRKTQNLFCILEYATRAQRQNNKKKISLFYLIFQNSEIYIDKFYCFNAKLILGTHCLPMNTFFK